MSIRQVQKVGALLAVVVLCLAILMVVLCWPSSSNVKQIASRPEPMLTLPYRVPPGPVRGVALPYHIPVQNTPAASSL